MGKKKRSVATDVINTLISAGINWERELQFLRDKVELNERRWRERNNLIWSQYHEKAKQARDLVDLVRQAERQTGFRWPDIGGEGDLRERVDKACKALNTLIEINQEDGGSIKVYSGEKPEVR